MSINQILSSYKRIDKAYLDTLEKTFETAKLIDFVFMLMPNSSKQAQGGKLAATVDNNTYIFQIYKGFVSVEYEVNGVTEFKLYENISYVR